MTDIFLASHNDDETLFGAFTILRVCPVVVICYRSAKQATFGITHEEREQETQLALQELGDPDWIQGSTPDTSTLHDDLSLLDLFAFIKAEFDDIGDVYAPAIEAGGHEQHNLIGLLANGHFGDKVSPYLTYRRGHMRTVGTEVKIEDPSWVAAKMRALSHYQSQIGLRATEPWFLDDTLREYVP